MLSPNMKQAPQQQPLEKVRDPDNFHRKKLQLDCLANSQPQLEGTDFAFHSEVAKFLPDGKLPIHGLMHMTLQVR